MGAVPRVMSTQHPDNVRQPFFCDGNVMEWEDEIKEAFYVYSHLKCSEQLWDYEGKEVDNFVVKKLLSRYETYFRKKTLGEDLRLTLRVPNPAVEKTEGKVLVETLMSIARSSDTASLFYERGVVPVFEVAVPMCSSEKDALKVRYFYRNFISGIENNVLVDEKVKDWIGKIEPKDIGVIPLVETKDAILESDAIIKKYLKETKDEHLRFWIARSDTALNYSSLGAVLIIKTALDKIEKAAEEMSADVLPILGCGSAPFRGNFRPRDYEHILRGYPSVHTFTIQSSFKYDNDEEEVRKAVEGIEKKGRGKPIQVEEERIMPVLDKVGMAYEKEISLMADMINRMAAYVPERRMRKLHVGLFGYSRSSKGIHLPRAIKFCAALYSYGLPPEILGLGALGGKDIEIVEEVYPNFRKDMATSLQYLNKENMKYFPREIQNSVARVLELGMEYEENRPHSTVTRIIVKNLEKQMPVEEDILRAGWIRGFLG
ncbi:phosphoenolpyruvate carboxylase [Candidatus Micrarchaeota archaeon]|nr:phosphoenolpyruvate carboxylase [Candidatus Micrarchaeota archaeon]